MQSGLRGGAQHGGTAVILDELGDRTDAGIRYSRGSICASSKMMTLLAILWSLRQREDLFAKRDSKKLDVGGDDNGFVPIFGGEAARSIRSSP